MKIIIAGAGEVGFHLAKLLAGEKHDIVLIDTSKEVLEYAASHIDVSTVIGDSTSIKVLHEANTKKADLLIAVSSFENTNIITAVLGKRIGAKNTIARVNKNEYLNENVANDFRTVGIDLLISPKLLASQEINRLLQESELTDIHEFELGKLNLAGITLDENSLIIDKSIKETAHLNPDFSFRPIAIKRGVETIIPRGNAEFKCNDHIYFITKREGLETILKLSGKERVQIKNVMILGGSTTGLLTAQILENKYKVTLIEKDKARCLVLAEQLNNTLIINGDGSYVDLLEEEGLDNMDAFIALTGNSDTNIISSLVAKNHNVHKTIALVDNVDYINLSQKIGVDTLINRKLIAANHIFRYVRKGHVKDIGGMHGVDAQVLEYEANYESKITGKLIKEIDFPREAIIGGVIRGDNSFIPTGDFRILVGDQVLVFALPDIVKDVAKFFS